MIANLLQVVTYSSAISSTQEAGVGGDMWKLGLQYLIDMKTLDLQGNLISYNSMIATYAMSDVPSWHLALQSLDEVKQQMKGDIITSASTAVGIPGGDSLGGGRWKRSFERFGMVTRKDVNGYYLHYNWSLCVCPSLSLSLVWSNRLYVL